MALAIRIPAHSMAFDSLFGDVRSTGSVADPLLRDRLRWGILASSEPSGPRPSSKSSSSETLLTMPLPQSSG
eukprot:CAMPEP_0185166034 /NCGR_PEP_ID=MMETSP1139-20130426/11867_1 /TAXON_ID=298111 /ORGANISM="Pavlova sp., Strain CCMP459" /LENGTH=71 /DNA_ID=CAMNT_0027731467 /DNA_START=555 /DNA_END=766 /DNA_ORIENTATION=+